MDILIIKHLIQIRNDEHLIDGNVVLPQQSSSLTFVSFFEGPSRWLEAIEFFNNLNLIKTNLLECFMKKTAWMNVAEQTVITASLLNKASKDTFLLSQKVWSLIEMTREMVNNRSTPLSLLRGFYLQNIKYNLKDAKREIRKIIVKPYYYGMDALLDEDKKSERENYLK